MRYVCLSLLERELARMKLDGSYPLEEKGTGGRCSGT